MTLKLTQDEHRDVTELAERFGQARSEWIRGLILGELQRKSHLSQVEPILAEIVGLLFVNPLAAQATGKAPFTASGFEYLLEEMKRVKRQLVLNIQRDFPGESQR